MNGKSRVMYLERKTGVHEAFIGRVTASHSGRTLYFRDLALLSVGDGNSGNYFAFNKEDYLKQANAKKEDMQQLPYDIYWVSGPKKNGDDRLSLGKSPTIHIDDDAREEYWRGIRKKPSCIDQKTY